MATAVVGSVQIPHGGHLCELIPQDEALVSDLKQEAKALKKLRLTQRQVCDLELLLNGGFSPLRGFLNKDDYERYQLRILILYRMRGNNQEFFVGQCCREYASEVRTALADADHARRDGGEGFRCLATEPFPLC
jgi:hypothetical protein